MNRLEFSAVVNHINELWPKDPLSDSRIKLFWKALCDISNQVAVDAIDNYAINDKNAAFSPMPAHIKRYLPQGKAHPGADEAWAIAIKASDERESLIWTQQIAAAWGIAQPMYDDGDKIGARMAFKDAYNRIVDCACEPVAIVSIGWDKDGREDVVPKAIKMGLLPVSANQTYLESPESEHSCVKLLNGPKPKNKKYAKRWDEIRKALNERIAENERLKREEDTLAKIKIEDRRQELLDQFEKLNQINLT